MTSIIIQKKLVQQSCKPHWAGPQSHQRYHRRRGQALSHPTCHDNHDLNLRTWAWASLTLCKKTRDIKTYNNIGNSSLSVQFPQCTVDAVSLWSAKTEPAGTFCGLHPCWGLANREMHHGSNPTMGQIPPQKSKRICKILDSRCYGRNGCMG